VKLYRACAFIFSLTVITTAAALFSPGTGAASTGRAVMMRLAQGPGAPGQAAVTPRGKAPATLNDARGRNVVSGSAFSQALSGKPMGKPGDDTKGGGGSQTVPDGASLVAPVGSEGAGGEGGASAGNAGSAGGGGGENTTAGEGGTGSGEGAAGGQAGAPVDERELAAILSAYHSRIVSLIKAQKRYPQIARRLGHQGVSRLSFTLAPDGSLISSSIGKSSGFSELDEAALSALRAVARFPAFPTKLGASPRPFIVSLEFTLD
jgi:TonB family protein